jgi:DNA recombination protein RmuC
VGSLETQVIVQARRFEDLKVDHEGRELATLSPIETAVRPIAKLSTTPEPQIRIVGGDDA